MAHRIIYNCSYVDKPLSIDGILNEDSWHDAETLEFFIPVSLQTPLSRTEAKILYDDRYLYIGFRCYDLDIRATYTERDSFTWEQDVVEAFIKPSINDPGYFEFEFSPVRTIFDAFLPSSEYRQHVIECSKWNCDGIVIGSFIKGTLNDSSDMDEYWSIEVGIPFKGLPLLKGRTPAKNERWIFHLARYDYSVYNRFTRELSSCARLTTRDFHNLDDALFLEFR